MSKSQTKAERKKVRKRFARYLKQLFAAYHFLNTTRDGAVIAQVVGCNWILALRHWQPDFKGDTQLHGEYFKSVVGDSIVHRSLKHASRLWGAMVKGRETRDLRKTLQMFEDMGFTE